MKVEPDFGLTPTADEVTARVAACGHFMGALLRAGEYASTMFYLHFSRLYAQRMLKSPSAPTSVRPVRVALASLFVHRDPDATFPAGSLLDSDVP